MYIDVYMYMYMYMYVYMCVYACVCIYIYIYILYIYSYIHIHISYYIIAYLTIAKPPHQAEAQNKSGPQYQASELVI